MILSQPYSPEESTIIVRLLARVAALDRFLATEDGLSLLIAYRRASNIVSIEEGKGGWSAGEIIETDYSSLRSAS